MAYRLEDAHGRTTSRETAKWALGIALLVSLTATLLVLQLFQMSGKGAAKPALERAINALAEGDATIARQYDALQAEAEVSEAGASIVLEEYPVQVRFTRDEVLGADMSELHELALERATDRMYDEGTSAIRDEEATGGPGRFSSAGAVDEFLGLLTDDTRRLTTYATIALAGLSALLAAGLAMACRGYGRIGAPGIALLSASVLLLLAGALARISADDAAGSEYVRSELMAIAEELAMLPIRNGAALSALGGVLVVLALAASRLTSASHERSRGVS